MKLTALTVKQPWATLMVTADPQHPKQAYKPLEGRTWETSYRGSILIHTGQQTETGALQAAQERGQDFPQSYPKGAIVGMATLVACRRPTVTSAASLFEEWEALFGRIYDVKGSKESFLPLWLSEGSIWLWEFQNPVRFKEPIPCKGKLRLWTPDPTLSSDIKKQIVLAQS